MAATALPSEIVKHFFGNETPTFVYEDDQCVAFDETRNQQAPVHFVVVPRRAIPRLSDAADDDERLLGHMLLVAKDVARERGLSGYHVVVDEDHVAMRMKSLHVFGRALHHMAWPVGPGARL